MKMHENIIKNSQVRGRAAAANHAAVPPTHTSLIHFDWLEATGNAVGMASR
jgi:hypothetical protein